MKEIYPSLSLGDIESDPLLSKVKKLAIAFKCGCIIPKSLASEEIVQQCMVWLWLTANKEHEIIEAIILSKGLVQYMLTKVLDMKRCVQGGCLHLLTCDQNWVSRQFLTVNETQVYYYMPSKTMDRRRLSCTRDFKDQQASLRHQFFGMLKEFY